MASLDPKARGADQLLGPEFLVSSFSIDIYFFQRSFKWSYLWGQKSIKIGQGLGSIGLKGAQTSRAYYTFMTSVSLATIQDV